MKHGSDCRWLVTKERESCPVVCLFHLLSHLPVLLFRLFCRHFAPIGKSNPVQLWRMAKCPPASAASCHWEVWFCPLDWWTTYENHSPCLYLMPRVSSGYLVPQVLWAFFVCACSGLGVTWVRNCSSFFKLSCWSSYDQLERQSGSKHSFWASLFENGSLTEGFLAANLLRPRRYAFEMDFPSWIWFCPFLAWSQFWNCLGHWPLWGLSPPWNQVEL